MWKDCETNIDLLDFDYLVDVTKQIILNNNLTPSTIGIYGDWGSGKSSLMDMVKADLSEDNKNLCLKFNGWLFEGYEDAKIALVGSILDEISKKKKLSKKAKEILANLYKNTDFIKLTSKLTKFGIDIFLTGGNLTLTDLTIDVVKSKLIARGAEVKEGDIEEILKAFKGKELRKSVKSFHEDFEKLLEQSKINRLVVFIDELDRCNHDTILDTLEAIRLFLFAKGTSFVIGADERQIRYAVQMKYPEIKGNQIDIGKEYLEKLIQFPIRIPQLGPREVELYIMNLLFEKEFPDYYNTIQSIIKEEKEKNYLDFELTYNVIKNKSEELADKLKDTISLSKQISSVLSRGLNGNPRHCKRFLNTMELRIQMANYREITLDRRILAKIMLAEYFRDTFYKLLAQIQVNENGRPKDINFIEDDKWDEVKVLSLWKNDSWIIKWFNIEPSLSNVDLRPYFYFSRESLRNISYINQQNLSDVAATVLDQLLSGSDTLRNKATQSAPNVTEYEAANILKTILAEMEKVSEIGTPLFNSYIEWGNSRPELYVEVLSGLQQISANQIKPSFIPFITDFANQSNNQKKIIELYTKWKTENPKLTSAIEAELNE